MFTFFDNMADSATFYNLPDEVVLHILTFLDYSDIRRVSSVCKRLTELGHCDLLWKPLCQKYWRVSNCPSHLCWWDIFGEWYRDYGRYIDVYRFIRKAWDQIEDYFDDYYPNISESLQDGLSEEEINAVEVKIKRSLPNDFRCVYRIHNGQRENMADMGLFGALQVYNLYSDLNMLDLKSVANAYPELQKNPEWRQFTGCIPFSKCKHSGTLHYLALTTEHGYTSEQVFVPTENSYSKEVAFDDFILANSFMEHFVNFANNLEAKSFPNVDGQMFRFLPNPKTKLKTREVEVDVATCFCPEQSYIHPPEYVHAYRITLSMAEDAPPSESCQLESRHWIITDESGKEQRVDGPGVVGEFPIMRPDTTFSWISCTSFKTTHGTMGGHFTMRNLVTGNKFELQCPTFHMKCLPHQTSDDCEANVLRVKKDL